MMAPRNDQAPLQTPPDSGLGAPSIRSNTLVSTNTAGSGPTPSEPPRLRGKYGKERRDCFLETVLGAPKAAVNQEPYVNTGLLQRPRRVLPEPETTFPTQIDTNFNDLEESGLDEPLSPSNQLDIAPRIMMRGRETKTRFSGSGIYANLVAQVWDLPLF